MTLTFDRNTLGNRTLAPVLTAFVLSGLLGIVTEDSEAAESANPAQTEYGSPVSLSQEALPVLETPFTPYLDTDTQAIMIRAVRFQEEGDHDSASELFAQAWQIARVSNGLYHQSLIPIVERMITSEVALKTGRQSTTNMACWSTCIGDSMTQTTKGWNPVCKKSRPGMSMRSTRI